MTSLILAGLVILLALYCLVFVFAWLCDRYGVRYEVLGDFVGHRISSSKEVKVVIQFDRDDAGGFSDEGRIITVFPLNRRS